MAMSKLEIARGASGLSKQAAADLLQMSVPTYVSREKDPDELKVKEIKKLASSMNDEARAILKQITEDIFLPSSIR